MSKLLTFPARIKYLLWSCRFIHKAAAAIEKLKTGPSSQDYDLIICTEAGNPVNPENLKKSYVRLIQAAGVPKIRFHDLRQTRAARLLSQGIDAKEISGRLGHSNIKATLDIFIRTCFLTCRKRLKSN
ncbi:hypothetical protein BTO30_11710 [Domibacillus antri]|uniref:Tyr recombinase domain-containing protein n=1 Tax=Domibacillus antri TaxID=1714264 RepID=A0A1Q8Q3Q4_9BACI|nr:tyrosine-type recombinase/integrase [Domibacillus antri]OLN21993.1 hypothetical protein BTO30_11710 [Domibacillus antri]